MARVDEWMVRERRQLAGRETPKKWSGKGRKYLETTRLMAEEAAEPRESFFKKRD